MRLAHAVEGIPEPGHRAQDAQHDEHDVEVTLTLGQSPAEWGVRGGRVTRAACEVGKVWEGGDVKTDNPLQYGVLGAVRGGRGRVEGADCGVGKAYGRRKV